MEDLRFKRKYFRMVASRSKDLECRINYPFIRKIKKGSAVKCFWEDESYNVKIKDIRHYKTFQEMLTNEDIQRLVPGMSFNEALREYQKIYPNWKVKKFGIVVFELVPA